MIQVDLLWSSFFVTLRAKKSYYDDAPFSNGIMLFFVLQRGFYSYCKNEVFYDCTLCKQILLLLYTKLLLSGILLSCRSIIVQLYLLLPSDRYRQVKSVHHFVLISSHAKSCSRIFLNNLQGCPFVYPGFLWRTIDFNPISLFIYLCTVNALRLIFRRFK